jgi:hypothetical protein
VKSVKVLMAAAAVTVYVVCPAYRYYVIGSWIGYKILNDKPGRYRIVPRGSKTYSRVLKGA